MARRYWDIHISPHLSANDVSKVQIYFPIAPDLNGLNSVLGRWRWQSVVANHQALNAYLLNLQPFQRSENTWLAILNDISVKGKHIDLVPQTRREDTLTTVTGQDGGSVSWGSGVTFGRGVSIMGAPIDPHTQRIVPTSGVTEAREIWVSFIIDGHGVNALGFCSDACRSIDLYRRY